MNKRVKKNIRLGIIAIAIVILGTLVVYWYSGSLKVNTEKLSDFGGFIGGFLGVLLTTVATVLIYLTYDSQKKELELSRKLFSKQNFENSFFSMLNVHQGLRKEMEYISNPKKSKCSSIEKAYNVGEDEIVKGKSFFIYMEKEFRCLWKYENPEYFNVTDSIAEKHKAYKYENHPNVKVIDTDGNSVDYSINKHLKDVIELKYPIFWETYANHLGDYFRNIYHILKFISEEKSQEMKNAKGKKKKKKMIKEKYKRYADILQSQLSFSELFLIFYNALKFPNMKELVEEFDFIENLHISNLLHPKHAEFEGMGKIKEN